MSASVDPCAIAADAPADVPDSCVSAAPTAPTGAAPSKGSAAYKPLKLAPEPAGQLKAVGNDTDVAKTSDSFPLVVQPGYRVAVHAICEGRTKVTVTTVPDSGAGLVFNCGFQGQPSEIGSINPTAETAAKTYQVTVSVPAPARWFLNFYETNAPLPADGLGVS